jgi:hypothetical protein
MTACRLGVAQEGIEAAVRIRFEGAYDSKRVKPTRCASTLPWFGAPYWRGPVRRRLRQARLNLVEARNTSVGLPLKLFAVADEAIE